MLKNEMAPFKPAINWYSEDSLIRAGGSWVTFGDDHGAAYRLNSPQELAEFSDQLLLACEALSQHRKTFVFTGSKNSITRFNGETITVCANGYSRHLLIQAPVVYDLQRWLAWCANSESFLDRTEKDLTGIAVLQGGEELTLEFVSPFGKHDRFRLGRAGGEELLATILAALATPFRSGNPSVALRSSDFEAGDGFLVSPRSECLSRFALYKENRPLVGIELGRAALARVAFAIHRALCQ